MCKFHHPLRHAYQFPSPYFRVRPQIRLDYSHHLATCYLECRPRAQHELDLDRRLPF
ncbi:hypothetical protein ZOSMA_197G00020 [Zostera marina]|uniref:Uncharacterized protein n=1 Tax=Zostera marina TaxID=29655 RepID=A0A0K9PNV9_ZOSMR|nr:hypothetical protein ZOSMA_197G00020 [Zostera marina]